MLNPTMRRKARQFAKLARRSALTPRTGFAHKPILARRGELGLTFIGHSSFLVQIGGKNLLIDPNFASWIFVLKRLRQPGLTLHDLPPIDAVLVSHAHFDHLHRPSLRAIARATRRKTGKLPAIVVPQRVHDLVDDLGYARVIEMDWWESLQLGSVEITHTPAKHWGARVIHDTHRGYGGFVLRGPRHSLYHSGDTAYFSGFQEIRERLHPKVALLPIGAYYPESYRNVHTSPEDAVQAFRDLRAQWMVPMHYGTFRLGHEPIGEPLERLMEDARRYGVEEQVCVLEEGVTKIWE